MAMAKRRVLTPDSVVQTAAELANEACGIEAVTLNRLAEALDIKVPSLYNHVNGLAGLRRDLTLLAVQDLLRQLRQAVRGVAGREALLNVAHGRMACKGRRPSTRSAACAASCMASSRWNRPAASAWLSRWMTASSA